MNNMQNNNIKKWTIAVTRLVNSGKVNDAKLYIEKIIESSEFSSALLSSEKLDRGEGYLIAVLPESEDGKFVIALPSVLAKQRNSRINQNFTASDYLAVQSILDNGEKLRQQQDTDVFIGAHNGVHYVLVISNDGRQPRRLATLYRMSSDAKKREREIQRLRNR